MTSDKFQIGDRVRLVKRPSYMPCQLKEGDEGVVVSFEVGESFGVDWGRDIGGHDCGNGACPIGHGFFVATKHIELVTEAPVLDISNEEFFGLLKDQ